MDLSAYVDLFIEESRDRVTRSFALLDQLELSGRREHATRELMRHAHSLKGMAATMGFAGMTELSHAMEDLYESVARSPAGATVDTELLSVGLVSLSGMIDAVERGEDAVETVARDLAERIRGTFAASPSRPKMTVAAPVECAPTLSRRFAVELELEPGLTREMARFTTMLRSLARLARIESVDPLEPTSRPNGFDDRLRMHVGSERDARELGDALQALDGVLHAAVTESPRTETSAPRRDAAPGDWARVRGADLDALVDHSLDLQVELSRLRAASSPGARAMRHMERIESLLRELHGVIVDARTLPFSSLVPRLKGCVQEAAAALDKRARIVVAESALRVDRTLLDALGEALTHMLRNAVDHGVEPVNERVAAGKTAHGNLRLEARRQGEFAHVVLQDDGPGLDLERIRVRAIELGLVQRGDRRLTDDRATAQLITLPAFSTSSRVGSVSGRGIGMNVVREIAERHGGVLELSSDPGSGTRLELRLPLNLSVLQVLVVRAAGDLFAIPAAAVVRAVSAEDGNGPRRTLAERLGIAHRGESDRSVAAVAVIESGEGACCYGVQEIVGRREVVVRPLGAPLDRLAAYSGAAMIDGDELALVIDPRGL
ncbi:MAG: hypothetical protein GY715_01525 [Planctomycetes bacterium]|nr:hypothetical protein [Planctomycetota bacterium]